MQVSPSKLFLLSAVLAAISCIYIVCAVNFSDEDISSEESCIKKITKDHAIIKSTTIATAMRRGYWKCAAEMVTSAKKVTGTDFRNVFDMEQRTIVTEMANLKSVIESSLPMATVSPAFQWAQSPTEILLNVKFSHKIDAPATLNVEAKTVNVTDSKLVLQASDGRKLFNLEIDFLYDVLPEESSWSMASVGRMTFTIKKAGAAKRWFRLTKQSKKLPQMHMWWEMQEKYTKELDALDDDDDDDSSTSKLAAKKQAPPAATDSDVTAAASAVTAAADGEDGIAAVDGSGAIISEEEQARLDKQEQLRKLDEELKAKLSAIDDQARRKKKEIDVKTRSEKASVDAEAEAQRVQAEATVATERRKITGEPEPPAPATAGSIIQDEL